MRYIFGGKNYYIAIPPPPICQGGKSHFSGGKIYYSHFPAYPGKGGKWEKWLWGKNGSIIPNGERVGRGL